MTDQDVTCSAGMNDRGTTKIGSRKVRERIVTNNNSCKVWRGRSELPGADLPTC